jgi:hypothetical protein
MGCDWSASSDVEWLSIVGARGGVGMGTVHFRASGNGGPARVGSLTIADRKSVVRQGAAGSGCQLAIGKTEDTVKSSGGTDVVAITGPSGCPWVAQSDAAWIAVTSGAAGSGNGMVGLSIAENGGGPRLGIVRIAGQTYSLTQAAPATGACSFSISPTGQSMTAAGGPAVIGVKADRDCTWSVSTQTPWMAPVVASGTGNGTVIVNVALNTGAQRKGTIAVEGQVHTITQAAAPALFPTNME